MMDENRGKRMMILLEGNVGAGKSTVGRALAMSGNFGFIEEPTKAWQEDFASNMLELVYSDLQRWSFTFQICAFITRAKNWHEVLAVTDHDRVILERSIFCDRFVFAENCYRTGLMSPVEYQILLGLWNLLVSNFCDEPDVILYLRTPAEVCLQRLRDRGRGEESGITLDYLLQLERLHDDWLLDHPKAVVLNGERQWTAAEILAEIEFGQSP
jgi:deoxyadenosine/deoxycytidine kinase